MDEKKKAPADAGKGTQEPAKKQTDNNTERENISFKEEPETALDNLLNYEFNGGKDKKERERLYSLLSDDEKEKYEKAVKELKESANNLADLIYAVTGLNENIKQLTKKIIMPAGSSLSNTLNSIHTGQLSKIFSSLIDSLEPVSEWEKEKKAVLPYLENELKKEEYNGATPDNVFAYFNFVGTFWPDILKTSENEEFREAAKTVPAEFLKENKITPELARQAWENAKKAKNNAVKVVAKSTNQYPLDVSKAGLNLWNSNVQQGKTAFDVTKKAEKNKNPADKVLIVYDFDFSELNGITTTKNLTSYDRLVYSAIAGIRNAGNTAFTDRQVFTVIEGNKRPAANQLKKIRESIKKMARVYVTVDNAAEAEKYKSKNFYKYTGSVLPIEILENVSVNGNVTDVAYHILENKLPLIDISKERNELTTVPAKLLQVPLNKTDTNLEIGFYIQTRVKREEHAKKTEFKILLETLYKHAHIETKKQKQRAPEKVKAILDYYVNCDFIRAYKMESDSVIITLKQE